MLQRLPSEARVAIIRLRSLGDCVLTTPAIALCKQARPDLKLAVAVEARFAPIFQGNPDIDVILSPGLAGLARWQPHLTLNLHGGFKSAQLTMASRARLRAGFAHFRFQSIYNIRIPRAQEILGVERKVHTAEHLASAMFYLGVPAAEIPRARLFTRWGGPPGPQPTPSSAPWFQHGDRGVACGSGEPPHYAVIHPCASAPDKTWPPGRFREVARYLQTELDLEPVFIAGPGESLAEFDGYRSILAADLEDIKSLLAGAALFIGNDSGPAHMAAAFGLPVVVLFGASDPEIWGPWKTEASVLTSDSGIAGIESDRVFAAISSLAAQATR